jgi:hypothetical protein
MQFVRRRSPNSLLAAGIAWAGMGAFAIVFAGGAHPPGISRLALAVTVWGVALFWPTIISLLIRWRGNERWQNSSAEAFFWLSLFISPVMCLLAFA